MRSRSGGLVAAGAAVVLLLVCVLLTRSLWAPGQDGAARANVLALPVGLLSLVASVASGWFAWRALQPAPQLRDVARELRDGVRRDRDRFMTQALGARYTVPPARVAFANPQPGALPAQAETLLLNWQDVDGVETGSLDDVADFYGRQPSGRLVVLGAPGAGKTVLLSRLVLDLIDRLVVPTDPDLPDGLRVPVLFSLPSCDLRGATADTAVARLTAWMLEQLVENYALSAARATELVRRGHVLPVLDGLDEMDEAPADDLSRDARPRAAALLDALNWDRSFPVVLACRELEYHRLTHDDDRRLLVDARHVTVRPLAAADVVAYLVGRFGGRSRVLPSRWQPIATELESGGPLLEVLQNPWQLFLAVTAYAEETSEPDELLDMTPAQVEDHLLAALVPAVVEQDRSVDGRWTATEVQIWLGNIARHQQRLADRFGAPPTDINLLDLWWMSGRRYPRYLPALAGAVICVGITVVFAMLAASLSSLSAIAMWVVAAVMAVSAFTVAVGAFDRQAPTTRLDLAVLAGQASRRRFLRELKRSTVSALAFGFVLGLPIGSALFASVRGGILSATAVTLGLWLLDLIKVLGADLGAASLPSVLTRQCLYYSVARWFVTWWGIALSVFLLIAGTSSSWTRFTFLFSGLFGLLSGTAFWLGEGIGSASVRHVLGVRSAVRQGLLPRHVTRFLDWCVAMGLMRMSGNSIQFRHAQLQRWLTCDEPEVAAPASAG